jgi:hypothetical protein
MPSSLPLPEIPREAPPGNRLSRRVFLGAAAALPAVAVLTGTAVAAPAPIDRAAGVARLGGTTHLLGRSSDGWVHVAADGTTRPARGLTGAEINAVAAHGDRLVAVGADRSAPAVWTSADGVTWRRTARLDGADGHLTAVTAHGGTALAVGALLTLERAPHTRIVLRDSGSGWTSTATTGLDHTAELTATAAGHDGTAWRLSIVDADGSLLFRSADGRTWTGDGTRTGVAVRAFDGHDWIGNTMGGTDGQSGTRRAALPDGEAVGVVDGVSYWLVDGHIVTATV